MNTHYLSAAGVDYEATFRSLTFNDRSRQSVFVPIINDDRFEDPENFFGRLSAADVLPPNVRLAPIEATATIIDDEGELYMHVLIDIITCL